MNRPLAPAAAEYVRSINDRDAEAFLGLFAEMAVVNDAGREFRGIVAIEAWAEADIFVPRVTLEVIDAEGLGRESTVTTKVDGNFDRTGLPDPVIIKHHITTDGGKIVGLTCRLAEVEATA